MNRTLRLVATEIGVDVEDLSIWIDRHWVLPSRCGEDWAFDEADRARVRMILDFRRDLAIDDETMPVVLNLLDRLHAARAQLSAVLQGVAELPEGTKIALMRRLEKGMEQ